MKTLTSLPNPRRQARHRGAVAVEFALVLIPLITLLVGVVEYGRALHQYNTLAKSVRGAVRYLTIHNPSDPLYPVAAARCLVVHGNEGCTGAALVPGLTTDMIRVCNPVSSTDCPGETYSAVTTGLGLINLVEVRVVGFPFDTSLPFVPGLNDIQFNTIRATMRQVL
ncbi:TadE/TadG family type IV pilus assembly protein [Hydrogenophaga sp. PBL-H3]|uniref:TadE/TadG family type IV pilus assembly protein n=1 Tax=Hydrogenophaga sp. PBL-H3 TaxID=434010 RepID=UPI00131FD630|nr:TadE family protein [Hydrogenophaga sp. PBL-H3]QHE76509.1 pilus assembly protein [Hydrogenophaga sp. PBL-H3]QHE80933.1 pilus assembly protein [Hydrogenophaga sp. PBL-H3]